MKIVIDKNIPFILKPLEQLGEVVAMSGDAIDAAAVKDADVLLTRTRTKCNAELLDGSAVKFIGTATIGTDHIDLPYCKSHGIEVVNAPGCNAPAVAQWVLSAVEQTGGFKGRKLGVIGAGNVGSILIRWARGLGMDVLVNDPPLQAVSPEAYEFVSLDEIAEKCDVITVHTPLTKSGDYPTYHLLNQEFIDKMRHRPLVLNAARGEVADTEALIAGLREGKISAVGIDCWEGEPNINHTLLEMATFATPHIAGYSQEGKIRGTQMVLDALSKRYGKHLTADAPALSRIPETITEVGYDISADTRMLKDAFRDSPENPFEHLRNIYNLRPEPKR